MSSLERFRASPSPFERYFDRFVQNRFRQRRFRIVLRNGEQVEGVPTTESLTHQPAPNVSFNLQAESEFYRIPFIELESADEL
jgi:hypothetical protein